MSFYADSSFLVSCYVADTNTTHAKTYLFRTGASLVFTALHALEVMNALKLGVFRGLFAVADANAAWRNLETDLRNGRLVKRSVNWPLAFLSPPGSAIGTPRRSERAVWISCTSLLRRRCVRPSLFRSTADNASSPERWA